MIKVPDIIIEKSPVPIIWLDTSIVIDMTLWKLGRPIEKKQKERVSFLYNTIYTLTRKKRIICPEADQKEEIWKGRSECLQSMLELSLGIRALYSESIKYSQAALFMDAFINKKNTVQIKYQDFFENDPTEQLSSTSKYIVSVDLGLMEDPELIKKRNLDQINRLEKLRQSIVSKEISFEEQLEKEYKAELDTVSTISRKNKENLNYIDFMSVNDYWIYWNQLDCSFSKFLAFLTSPFYRKIPKINIDCQISAKILTGNDPFKTGHKMDIVHSSSAIPYVNIFITDRYMKKIICDLGIDITYNTKVLNIAELNQIEKYFNEL